MTGRAIASTVGNNYSPSSVTRRLPGGCQDFLPAFYQVFTYIYQYMSRTETTREYLHFLRMFLTSRRTCHLPSFFRPGMMNDASTIVLLRVGLINKCGDCCKWFETKCGVSRGHIWRICAYMQFVRTMSSQDVVERTKDTKQRFYNPRRSKENQGKANEDQGTLTEPQFP